jgi:membrane associated rhomboid family serine protease
MIPLKDNFRYLVDSTATTVLILLNCLFFIVEQSLIVSGHSTWIQEFGAFTPADLTSAFAHANPLYILLNVLSIFSSMFLHGGIMHILGNMAFLNCFGRAVEARLGVKRYVLFYLAGGVAAALGQWLPQPDSHIPCLGASGAIAAVLSAYLVFFPRARVTGLSMTMGFITASAWSFLPVWALSQVYSVIFEQHGGGGVAYMAHLGGFAFGLAFAYLITRLRPHINAGTVLPERVECPVQA